MTEVQGAFKHKDSRFYWASDVPEGVREALEPELIENFESLGVAARSGLVKPSLTTFIRDSGVLTAKNSKLTTEEFNTLKEYLQACKQLENTSRLPLQRKVGEGEGQRASLERVFGLGTQIHLVAELVAGGASFKDAKEEAAMGMDPRDMELFESYADSLSKALDNVPTFEAEVGLERERFKGTADAITADTVIDWKTGGAYLSKNALQLTALAVASGRKQAALVILSSHGASPVVIWLTDGIMSAAVVLILAGLRLFEEQFEGVVCSDSSGEVIEFETAKGKLLSGEHVIRGGVILSKREVEEQEKSQGGFRGLGASGVPVDVAGSDVAPPPF